MSTPTDYRTRELAKRDRQEQRRTGRTDKQAAISAFAKGAQLSGARKLRGTGLDASFQRGVGRVGDNMGDVL